MKEKLTENFWLRVFSVIIAFVVWIVIVNVSDPIVEMVYSGVKVELLNASEVTKDNMTYQVLDNTDNISVTVVAKRSVNELLSKDNIRAYADMKDLNEENGSIKIHLEANRFNDKIESIKSKTDSVMIDMEPLQKKMLYVTPVVNGEPLDGYITGDVTLDQNVVSVQGPESVISIIETATAEVSVTGMSNNISTTSSIRYYDENGDPVDAGRITGNISAVSVKVEILATKSVPITFASSGTPADGYAVANISAEDGNEIYIAGKVGTLAGISSINIPGSAIDVEDKSEPFEMELDINKYLADSVSLADSSFDGKLKVKVDIEKMESSTIDIPKGNITIKNAPDGTKITVDADSKTIPVNVVGISAVLDRIDKNDIKGVINVGTYMSEQELDALEPGAITLPVTFTLPDGIRLKGDQFMLKCKVEKDSE